MDLSLFSHPGDGNNGDSKVPVSGIGIRVGAQVASLRCPILRANGIIIPSEGYEVQADEPESPGWLKSG